MEIICLQKEANISKMCESVRARLIMLMLFSVVSVCQALQGQCQDSLVMTSPGGWLELEEPPMFTKDGRRFAMALSANGYKQVNVINR